MAEQHPLTDEIILSIADESLHMAGFQEDMRVAADWQLSQVLEFIAADPMLGEHVKDYIFKAMRPQQGQ